MRCLLGKVAIVTGGNQGVGFATAEVLANQGFDVVIGCRNIESGNIAVNKLKNVGLEATCIELDVTKPTMVKTFVDLVMKKYQRIDILINNAAIFVEGDSLFVDIADNVLTESFNTNVHGPWLMCKTVVPIMIRQKFGRIVNVSSGWGTTVEMQGGSAAYRISKAGLNALTIILADELKNKGDIKVNAVCPGWVQTRMGGIKAPRKPIEAAEDIVWAATISKDGPNGYFFRNKDKIAW